jgi:hypothetical protein
MILFFAQQVIKCPKKLILQFISWYNFIWSDKGWPYSVCTVRDIDPAYWIQSLQLIPVHASYQRNLVPLRPNPLLLTQIHSYDSV